jgi:hypothetical protein
MSKMSSHGPFGHLKHKLWSKEESGVKLVVRLPIIKSRESTRFPCVQVACHISLESYRQGLQLCFTLHLDQRSAEKVMGPQIVRVLSLRIKCHLHVAPMERHRVYYKGEGGGFPQVRAVVSFVSPNCSWLVLAPKVFQLCTNHLVLVLCRSV